MHRGHRWSCTVGVRITVSFLHSNYFLAMLIIRSLRARSGLSCGFSIHTRRRVYSEHERLITIR